MVVVTIAYLCLMGKSAPGSIPSQVVTLQASFMAKAKERGLPDYIYKTG